MPIVKKKPAQARANKVPASRARQEKVTEIVFSHDEIDFLRKITGKQFKAAPSTDRAARLSLRDKLLDISLERSATGSGSLIVVELTRPELNLLQRLTKEVYSFITPEERRARLILREKIVIAAEKVLGKKIRVEDED